MLLEVVGDKGSARPFTTERAARTHCGLAGTQMNINLMHMGAASRT